ncbi:MAG: 50S ribosomal protein L11 methyltransferase, partial [Acidobacteria bacterium]|nr:50S ribosomal protein L11 methyltransferase [Acidobacteriota bacterium]
ALLVLIEPSMGFGTGHHATTRLCLRALASLDLRSRSFLDIGTGSGILAIAACLLGATPVIAIDTDPDAIESARGNLRLNGVTDRIQLVTDDFRRERHLRAATVVANLTGGALVQGCQEIARLVEGGGVLIVSGFTREETEQVYSALARLGQIVSSDEEDGWCTATVRVNPEVRTSDA